MDRVDHPIIDFRNVKLMPALCLDLDGTVRYSSRGEFITVPGDIVLFEGVEAKLWEFHNNGWLICGVTNQGGVAFGIKTVEEEQAEIDWTLKLFEKNPFHIIQSCYQHEKAKHPAYGHRSMFRKPYTGMLALCEYEAFAANIVIDWDASKMVGDRPEDKQMAENAEIGFEWAWQFFGRPEPLPEK